jgi:predicted DNA-binding transcriptional regulator AlpA
MLLERQLLVIQELCAISGFGPAKVYKDMRAGILPYKVRGGRRRITVQDARIYTGIENL